SQFCLRTAFRPQGRRRECSTARPYTKFLTLPERLRCPICSATNIKRRATLLPAWRCKSQHAFDEPLSQWNTISTYEAHYAQTFQPVGASLSVDDLHRAVIRPSDQMSIKEIDLARLEKVFLAVPSLRPILTGYAKRLSLEPKRSHNDDEVGKIIEARRTVLREISVRRGQPQFRNRLIARYGMQCQISGSAFPGLLEAAHIRPYAMSSDNSATNGLLLRSDLHTLFDLGILLINPQTFKVKIDARLLGCGYDDLEDRSLFLNGTIGPDKNALRDRWQFFEGAASSG
ncbi:HNH endonuclease, partial [Rhizobium sp. PP-CC-3A-592]